MYEQLANNALQKRGLAVRERELKQKEMYGDKPASGGAQQAVDGAAYSHEQLVSV